MISLKQLSLSLLFWILALQVGISRDFSRSSYLSRAEITIGSKLVVMDHLMNDAQHVSLRTLTASLNYNRNNQSDICDNDAWSYEIDAKVYQAEDPSNFKTYTLIIKHGVDNEFVFNSDVILEEVGSDNQVLEVTGISASYSVNGSDFTSYTGNTASTVETIPFDVELVFELRTEYYSYLDPTDVGYVNYDATAQEAKWFPNEDAEEYDLEWVFIDSEDDNYSILIAGAVEEPFNYKEPSRIRTKETKMFIPLIYPTGKIFFRVRPVGRYIEGVNGDYSHIKTGAWGYERSATESTIASCEITSGFEDDKIWQYQVSYAENGKNKRMISYHDGTLRKRQVATNINSEDISLVAETKYDYEGREAVHILPAPVPGFNLAYRDNFNVTSNNSTSFDKQHFDKDSPDPLYSPSSGQYGAEQYYSLNNQLTNDPYREVLPRSEGYAYTQNKYVNDNTGRVRRSSGVGVNHKISSGHDTKMFYGTPSSTELHRLFGTNVGLANHYKKNVVIDPNAQGSVSYMDAQGRTIATALVGDSPNNLVSIAPSAQNITVDLTSNNNYDTTTGEIKVVHRFINLETKTYTFDYQFDAAHYPLTVNNPDGSGTTQICLDCEYELEITITAPNGDWVNIEQATGTVQKIEQLYTGGGDSCTTTGSSAQTPIHWTSSFNMVGEYVVTKTVKVVLNDQTIENEIDNALGSMGIDLQTMINNAVANTDTTQCDFTCKDHCLTRVMQANPSWTMSANEAAILAAVADCEANWCQSHIDSTMNYRNSNGQSTECEALYDQLVADVSPGGWYYETNKGPGESVSNFWQFMDAEQALGNFVFFQGQGSNTTSTPATSTEIRDPNLWNDNWAAVAVQYHREYCHYELCMKFQDSKAYDVMMSQETDWNTAGGYTNPLTTPLKDPFLTKQVTLTNTLSFGGVNYSGTITLGTILTNAFSNFANGQTLIQFVSDVNSGLYTANVPYNTTNRYAALVALYSGLKNDLIREVKEAMQCNCYSDDEAIVKCQKDLKDPQVQDEINQLGSAFYGGGCEDVCDVNVLMWMHKLNDVYNGALFASASDSTVAYNTLYDYCINNPLGCNSGNPFGLITDSIFGRSQFSLVLNTFNGLGIGLDSIVVPNPYSNPCDSSYSNFRAHPDLAYLFDFLNNVYIDSAAKMVYGMGGEVFFDSSYYPELYERGVFKTYLHSAYTGSDTHPLNFNFDNCVLQFIIDSAGVPKVTYPAEIKHYYYPYYSAQSVFSNTLTQSSVSGFLGMQAVYFLNLRAKILINGKVVDTYIYSADPYGWQNFCFSPLLIEDTICVPEYDTSALPKMPTIDWNQRRRDCIEFMKAEAEHNATKQYERYRDEIKNQILESYYRKCLVNADEDFSATYQNKEYHYTLYYYDLAGNLVQTVPPAGVEPLGNGSFTNGVYNGTSMPTHRLKTIYKYNARNQVVHQQTPDGNTTLFYYNDEGQLRFSRNYKQMADGDFSYTKYDAQGRIVETGESSGNEGDLLVGITNTNYPSDGWQVTRTFYDENAQGPLARRLFKKGERNLRNRVSTTLYLEGVYGQTGLPDDEDAVTASHYSYDPHGNVKELVQESNVMPLTGSITKNTGYTYDLISGNVLEVNYQKGKFDEFNHRYRYDGDNRLLTARSSSDGYFWTTEAQYDYYLHGPLARTEVGNDRVQALDYAYTLQGWLKSVNASTGRHDLDPGSDGVNNYNNVNRYVARDAFGFSLGYYDTDSPMDYKPISSNHVVSNNISAYASSPDTRTLYNGNIADLTVALPQTGRGEWMPLLTKAFRYDQLNRISAMQTTQGVTSTNNTGSSFSSNYQTGYTYDANGNITSLARNGYGSTLAMDNLTYHYGVNSSDELVHNKLRGVRETVNSGNYTVDIDDWVVSYGQATSTTSDNYQYDEIGNLIKDASESIDNISWNIQGKISKITMASGSTKPDLEFVYGPDGNRVAKIVKTKTSAGALKGARDWEVVHYVRDASGNVMSTYKETFSYTGTTYKYESEIELLEHPIYGSSRLGLYKPDGASVVRGFSGSSTTSGWSDEGGIVHYINDLAPNVQVGVGSSSPVGVRSSSGLGVTVTFTATELGITFPGGTTPVTGTLVSIEGEEGLLLEPGTTATINVYETPLLVSSSGLINVRADAAIDLVGSDALLIDYYNGYGDEHYSERKLLQRSYELTDHLGNVLAVVSDKKCGVEQTTTDAEFVDTFADSFDDWMNIGGNAEANAEFLMVSLQEPSDYLLKQVHLEELEEGCSSKICVEIEDGAAIEGALLLIIEDNSSNLLYSFRLEAGYELCFDNLTLPSDIQIKFETESTAEFNLMSVSMERNCTEFDYYVADVLSAQDYYPFGMTMPGRSYQGSEDYRYGFNGKEMDNEVSGDGNQYDYGFRIYNPRIGRFLSVDPLFKSYAELTPYQFASNTPIWAIDLDGLEAAYMITYGVHVDKNGDYVTQQLGDPVLTNKNGDWSGVKSESQFIYDDKLYKYQSDIPGWSEWRNKEIASTKSKVTAGLKIAGGIVAVAAAIPTGGTSLSALGALGVGLGVTSGTYSVASGMAQLTLSFSDGQELIDEIPSGYLNATVGITITSMVDDQEVTEVIEATLTVVEGAATFNFKDPTALEKLDNAVNVTNVAVSVAESASEKKETSNEGSK